MGSLFMSMMSLTISFAEFLNQEFGVRYNIVQYHIVEITKE